MGKKRPLLLINEDFHFQNVAFSNVQNQVNVGRKQARGGVQRACWERWAVVAAVGLADPLPSTWSPRSPWAAPVQGLSLVEALIGPPATWDSSDGQSLLPLPQDPPAWLRLAQRRTSA